MDDVYTCMVGTQGVDDYTRCACASCISRQFEDEGLDGLGQPLPTDEQLYEMSDGSNDGSWEGR